MMDRRGITGRVDSLLAHDSAHTLGKHVSCC